LKLEIPAHARPLEKTPDDGWPFWFPFPLLKSKFENEAIWNDALEVPMTAMNAAEGAEAVALRVRQAAERLLAA